MELPNPSYALPQFSPTSSLPPLIALGRHSAQSISAALQSLRNLYWPPSSRPLPSSLSIKRRTTLRNIHDDSVPDSGYASAEDESNDDILEILRGDPFELGFAIKWVTGFISRSDQWINASLPESETLARMQILDDATSVLSAFMGDEDEAEGSVTRSFSFPSEGGSTVRVELNDAPLSSQDHTSVGLQSWASSILLAERICASPSKFLPSHGRRDAFRVLELGAGTGLLSIVATKLLQDSSTIIATDYHPDVLANLKININANFPTSTTTLPPIDVQPLDWENPNYVAPLDVEFDVILAADVIYHPEHAKWIKQCVERLLTRPATGRKGGSFWLVIPMRTIGRHEGMDMTVDDLFPDISQDFPTFDVAHEYMLAILDREETGRQHNVGRADEGGYKLYQIGWVSTK
ncbi:putative methyltransferase-domain-containing protein [Infundibulicybe gibba]|nr:putative methyltransferase-domain-containing protein [Infundibulicybe gibba]